MTVHHVVTRYAAAAGWVASCGACGWRSTRKTRELREQDAHAHELEDTLVVRHTEPDAVFFEVDPP